MDKSIAFVKRNNVAVESILKELISRGSVFPFISELEDDSEAKGLYDAALVELTAETITFSGIDRAEYTGGEIRLTFDLDGTIIEPPKGFESVRFFRLDELEEFTDIDL